MQSFEFLSPTRFVFGKGTETQVGSLIRELGGTRVLLVYGGGSVKRSGLYGRVRRLARRVRAFPTAKSPAYAPIRCSGLVYEGIELGRREGVDFVLP